MPFAFLTDGNALFAAFLAAEWVIRIVMLVVVPFRRSPDAAKGWLLLILFEPILGLSLYLVFGRRRLPAWRLQRAAAFHELARPIRAGSWAIATCSIPRRMRRSPRACSSPRSSAKCRSWAATPSRCWRTTARILDRLVADIDAAGRTSICSSTSSPTMRSRAASSRRSNARPRGVSPAESWPMRWVRVASGSSALLPRLRAAGIEAAETMRVAFFRQRGARMDLRNHRKIAVIDGHIGYTGSLNLVDPNFKPGLTYEELMVRATGPVVLELQAVFAQDWYLETGAPIATGDPFPDPEVSGTVPAQVMPSSPLFARPNNQRLIVALVNAARRRAVITTPYFIPDEALLQALTTAVLRGVDVRLVVPAQDDQILVSNAQKSYYGELLKAGVSICRYGKRFLHAKHATIDDDIAWIGSSNMDIRSFALNSEVVLLAYDQGVCAALREVQERYFRDGEWLDPVAWDAQPLYRQVGWNLARMFSSVL